MPATVTVPVPVIRLVTAPPPPHTPTLDAATPPPTASPAAATAIVATPMPTHASTAVAIALVPEPEPLHSVGNWQIHAKTYGDHTVAYAENQAIEYETSTNPPILTYQCFRGQSSLFIEWHQPLFTRPAPAGSRHAKNPFQEYCDNNRDALTERPGTAFLHQQSANPDRLAAPGSGRNPD